MRSKKRSFNEEYSNGTVANYNSFLPDIIPSYLQGWAARGLCWSGDVLVLKGCWLHHWRNCCLCGRNVEQTVIVLYCQWLHTYCSGWYIHFVQFVIMSVISFSIGYLWFCIRKQAPPMYLAVPRACDELPEGSIQGSDSYKLTNMLAGTFFHFTCKRFFCRLAGHWLKWLPDDG